MIREKSAIYDKQTEDYLICLRAYTYRHSKARRYTFIDNRKKDEWSGFADLLANLIEKYAEVLDIDNLPEQQDCLDNEEKENKNNSKLSKESIEKNRRYMI